MGVSIALIDESIHAALEPGTPTPRARLDLVRAIVQAGLPCQVLVAPILPMITDSDEQIDAVLGLIADAGATGATVFALHLRPGAREWFMQYLGRHHPELIDAYAELYQNGSYVTRSYATDLARRSSVLLRKHGLDRKESMLRIPDTSTAAVPPHLAVSEPSLF
jgi:DNA repair photolyase